MQFTLLPPSVLMQKFETTGGSLYLIVEYRAPAVQHGEDLTVICPLMQLTTYTLMTTSNFG